jgi:hypothetical protein
MGKKQSNFSVLIGFGLVIMSILLINYFTRPYTNEGFETKQSKIPNVIWTFWDGEPPKLVKKCIESWKKYNPDYEVILLNKENVEKYLPDTDLSKTKHVNDFVQRYSDYTRVHILAKYGGIWLDSSVICQKPLDWIHEIQNKTDVEFIGYFTESMSLPELKERSPVLENWAFFCTPNSKFVKDWRDEMMEYTKHDSYLDYSNKIVQDGVNPQKIPGAPNNITYFGMHLVAQKLMQEQGEKYNLHLMCAEETALSYLVEPGSNIISYTDEVINKSVDKILNKEIKNEPLLKLPGYMRDRIEKSGQEFMPF